MTAPCYDTGEQPDGEPWPEDSRARLAIYNGIVRTLPPPSGNVAPQLQRDGLPRRPVRGVHGRPAGAGLADGIHFTFTGGDVFAAKIWPFVLRLGHQQMTQRGSALVSPPDADVVSVWGNGSSNRSSSGSSPRRRQVSSPR